ncbi:MAG: type II toxin-antitoxin system VapB family antitoxin [Hyphomicrobiaceae bacterium]|nr:type II toxin-antitoxin system VapB family antitoxin [Hyphomicrobiaceae bacterium]
MNSLPADSETQRLAQAVASATGQPVATVVREAIVAKAVEAGVGQASSPRLSKSAVLERMLRITEAFASLPVLDARLPDEILGYDEVGAPT